MIDRHLRRLIEAHAATFRELDGRRIYLTGATGFVGVWMLRALTAACDLLGNRTTAFVLTRDPARFAARHPSISAAKQILVVAGDVRDRLPCDGRLDLIVHAAAETNVSLLQPSAATYFESSLEGSRRVVELARTAGASRILYTSSGAVYGVAAFENAGASEMADAAPDTTDSRAAYGNAKRACEAYLSAVGASGGPGCSIARLFTFVGPDLPLHSGFAAGNFIADALANRALQIAGDGTPLRSYLYAAEMAIWLWIVALRGVPSRAYNVGSEQVVSIRALAETIAAVSGGREIKVAGGLSNPIRPSRYIPQTARIRSELGVRQTVSLGEALALTLESYREPTIDLAKNRPEGRPACV